MSDILCVTNRKLCKRNFLQHIEQIAASYPAGIILREKDLTETEYEQLAEKVLKICHNYQIPCVLHNFIDVAIRLDADAIQLPLPVLRTMTDAQRDRFKVIGASCHSVEDAQKAEKLGCTYIIAGHIFTTDCKKGLPGRGLEFLQSICKSVSIPVYAIGGIATDNIVAIRKAGAQKACVMSGLMQCEDVASSLRRFGSVSTVN